jgi:hypothetical protein
LKIKRKGNFIMKAEIAIVRECVCKFFEQHCMGIAGTGDSNSQTFLYFTNKIFVSFFLKSILSFDGLKIQIRLEFYLPVYFLKGNDQIVVSLPRGEEIDYKEVKKRVFEALSVYSRPETFEEMLITKGELVDE